MSMGQQLGSGTRPDVLAGMTPAAGNKALPGGQPGRPPQNQLQQAMAPKGIGPVAPQPIAGLQSSSGQFKAPQASPMAPMGGYGMPVQTMTNAVRNSQQNMNTNIQQGRRR